MLHYLFLTLESELSESGACTPFLFAPLASSTVPALHCPVMAVESRSNGSVGSTDLGRGEHIVCGQSARGQWREGWRKGWRPEGDIGLQKKKMGAGGDERDGNVNLDKEAGRLSDTRAREVLEIFKTR